MESLVLKFCEELSMEFVNVEVTYLPGAKVKLRSYLGYGEPKSYIAWAVGNLRLILPARGLRGI